MYRVAKLLSLMSTGFLAGVFTYAYFANAAQRNRHAEHHARWHPGPAVVGMDYPRHASRTRLRRSCQHHEFDRGAGHALRKCAHQPASEEMASRTSARKLPGVTASLDRVQQHPKYGGGVWFSSDFDCRCSHGLGG